MNEGVWYTLSLISLKIRDNVLCKALFSFCACLDGAPYILTGVVTILFLRERIFRILATVKNIQFSQGFTIYLGCLADHYSPMTYVFYFLVYLSISTAHNFSWFHS